LERTVKNAPAKSVRAIPGFGPKSIGALVAVGITSVDALRARDPYELYRQLKVRNPNVSLNFLYAILAAQDGCHWREVQRTRRIEILLRLDDLRLAPD
jgi:DNA transformation protein and related proteins